LNNITFIFLALLLISCKREDVSPEETFLLVSPAETNVDYSPDDESHYILQGKPNKQNKLVLFIGGSDSVPKDYNIVCENLANLGFDVISLSYPNSVAAAPLGTSPDIFIFDNYRDEVCFGNSVSNEVSVDLLNSINSRTINLLQFLAKKYHDQQWDYYLTSPNNLDWSKIIVAGHSQGSGHACYLAKKNLVHRVVMFSGPNDYSSFYQAAGNWLQVPGFTPLTRHYALLHQQDEIVPFSNQVVNLKGLGLLGAEASPTAADGLTSPFNEANVLSINSSALSFHNSTVGGNSQLPAIWRYLFGG
jgi:pimeloyl-ACP methyl ester carboxylesterase